MSDPNSSMPDPNSSMPGPNLPITSTTSQTSTTCAPEYNTVSYTVEGPVYAAYRDSGMIPPMGDMVINKLSEGNTLTMCVKKKCPDGNYATNFGKLIDPTQNAYGCLYMPDTTILSNGEKSSTCKGGKPLSSVANNFGMSSDNMPEMCISSPQVYFPKFQ